MTGNNFHFCNRENWLCFFHKLSMIHFLNCKNYVVWNMEQNVLIIVKSDVCISLIWLNTEDYQSAFITDYSPFTGERLKYEHFSSILNNGSKPGVCKLFSFEGRMQKNGKTKRPLLNSSTFWNRLTSVKKAIICYLYHQINFISFLC